MIAREYTSRIEIWEASKAPDGYGGYATVSERIAFSWAKLVTKGVGRKAANMGITEFNDPLLFQVRHRTDLNYNGRNLYIVYLGEKYVIQGIANENMRNVDLEILCTRQEPETVPLIGVIRPITDAFNILYGNSDVDYFNNEENIMFQYNKDMLFADSSVSLDFQLNGLGLYIFFRVPTGTKVFTQYVSSNVYNGPIPDQIWHPLKTIGEFDYYLSRDPVYPDNDTLTFS